MARKTFGGFRRKLGRKVTADEIRCAPDLKFSSGCLQTHFELNCTRQFKSVLYENQD